LTIQVQSKRQIPERSDIFNWIIGSVSQSRRRALSKNVALIDQGLTVLL